MAAGKRAQCKALARDQDPWHAHMEQALADRNGRVIQSASDEAPGLLAYVEHHLGAHHSPDLFHVQHELSQAVSVPLATKQRAAAKAEETLKQAHEYLYDRQAQLQALVHRTRFCAKPVSYE